MKRIALILMAVALVTPAFAQVQNITVGGDLAVTGLYRNNFGIGTLADVSSNWLMSQIKVWLKAQVTDDISVVASIINEKDWGTEVLKTPPLANEITLNEAYVSLKNLMIPGMSLTAGRQEFVIADGLVASSQIYRPALYPVLLGAPDLGWQKAVEALKVGYENETVAVNVIKSKLYDNPFAAWIPIPLKDVDMYVADVAFNLGMFKLEPYATLVKANLGIDLWTYALLVKVSPIEGLAISGEYAMQNGDLGDIATVDFEGKAFNLGVDYAFAGGMKPRVSVGYALFSGQDAGADISAWIPVAPAGTADRLGKIATAVVGPLGEGVLSGGVKAFRAGVGVNPTEKMGVDLKLFYLLSDEATTDDIGTEADLGLKYDLAKDVSVGLDLGYLWTGDFFGAADNAWQAIASLKVSF